MSDHQSLRPVPPKPITLSAGIRRVLLGHDTDGSVLVQSDAEQPFQITPFWGTETTSIWKTTESPSTDNNTPTDFNKAPSSSRLNGLISSNGTHLMMSQLAPSGFIPMHRTSTIDYIIIMSGSLLSVTEAGDEVLLNAGDILVQKGGMHAWKNPGPEWARWACVIIDADPAQVDGHALTEGWL